MFLLLWFSCKVVYLDGAADRTEDYDPYIYKGYLLLKLVPFEIPPHSIPFLRGHASRGRNWRNWQPQQTPTHKSAAVMGTEYGLSHCQAEEFGARFKEA